MSLQTNTPTPNSRNYLNNRDMLVEIHKSKNSYCYFTKPEYADYDLIVNSKDDILSSVDAAFAAKAKKLKMAADSFMPTDLVFRVMCWDHIPELPAKETKTKPRLKKKAPSAIDEEVEDELILIDDIEPALADPVATKYVKLKFPPFVHYKITKDNKLELVGKSHWKGDLVTGQFSNEHGKPTNKLAMMWMKICERYVTKGNYRGYSFRDEMAAQGIYQLCNVGLQFNEAKSDNPFAFYTACITNSFNRVLNQEKKVREIRDDLIEIASLNPSYARQNASHVENFGGSDSAE